MHRRLSLLALLCLAGPVLAGPPVLQWQQTFAPTTGGDDRFGGAVIDAGGTLNILYSDNLNGLYLARYDASGSALPPVNFSSNPDGLSNDLTLIAAGGGRWIVTGRGNAENGGGEALAAAKYDTDGTLMWSTPYTSSECLIANGAGMDGAGVTYLAAGPCKSSLPRYPTILKVSSAGLVVWSRTITDLSTDCWVEAVVADPATGYYVGGWSATPCGTCTQSGGFLRKYDSAGTVVWTRTIEQSPQTMTYGLDSLYIAVQYSSSIMAKRFDAATGADASGQGYSSDFTNLRVGSVAVDAGGTVYVGGSYQPGAGQVAMMAAFRADLSATIWGQGYDQGRDEAVQNRESIVLVDSSRTPYFVNATGSNESSGCRPPADILVRKVSASAGGLTWWRTYDGPIKVNVRDGAVDASGNVFLINEKPALVVKYNSGGGFMWSQASSSTTFCPESFSRVVERAGVVYVSMSGNISSTSGGGNNESSVLMVERFDGATGNLLSVWAHRPAIGDCEPGPMAFNNVGDLLLGVSSRTNTGSGATYQIVVKFDGTTGAVLWSRTVAYLPTQMDGVNGIGCDTFGNTFVGGPGLDANGNLVIRLTGLTNEGNINWSSTYTATPGLGLTYPTSLVVSGGKTIVSGIDVDSMNSPSVWRGVLMQVDNSGSWIQDWTRTADGGQELMYWKVGAGPAGTFLAGGVLSSTILVNNTSKGGPDTAGAGDMIVYAIDPASPCPAPVWSARYDSGLGDESLVMVAAYGAGYTYAVAQTPAGGVVLKYANGVSEAAALNATIQVSPSPAEVGQQVQISLSVSNSGSLDALTVSTTLMVNSGAGGLAPLRGPWPSGTPNLIGGETKTWVWTTTATATPASPVFSATAVGLEVCSGTPRVSKAGAMIQTGYRSVMGSWLTVTRTVCGIGDWVKVDMTVTNGGAGGGNLGGVTATVLISSWSGIEWISGMTQTPVAVNWGGGPRTFSWTFSVSGFTAPGLKSIKAIASGQDPIFGYMSATSTGTTQIINQARLSATVQSGGITSVGGIISYDVTVKNLGAFAATGVTATLIISSGPGAMLVEMPPVPAGPQSIVVGGTTVFRWTATATAAGLGTFTVTVTGLDGSELGYPLVARASGVGTIQTRAALDARFAVPYPVKLGDIFTVVLSVTNTGQAAANSLSAPPANPALSAAATKLSGPTPASLPSLAGLAATFYTWTYRADMPSATLYFSATLTATDANTPQVTTANPTATSFSQGTAILGAWLGVNPISISGGQASLITLTVTNGGSGDAAGVTPALIQDNAASTDAPVGPYPASIGLMNTGGKTVFTWTVTGKTTGTVVFTGSVSGLNAADSALLFAWSSGTLSVSSAFGSQVTVTPSSIDAGSTFTLVQRITNLGGAVATSVVPFLIVSDAAVAHVTGGPVPASKATLSGGSSQDFTWTLEALKSGTVVLTATVSGMISGTPDGIKQAVTLQIKSPGGAPAFEGDAIVYPNPAGGDSFSVAVRLKTDASKIDMDVYNTGYQRVWHGEFPAALAGDWPLDVAGVSKWAPGVYLIRIRATLTDGGTKVFPTLRVAIKR